MRGSCLCRTVIYEVSRLDSPIAHCSCDTCRKSHSAAFNTYAEVKHEHFKWVSGKELLASFESSPGKKRYFCPQCGTQLIAQREREDHVILRVGSLDDDPGVTPQFQIWASHEVPWLSYGKHIVAYGEWELDHR